MKRKYYKESFIAQAVVLLFDFVRLFYVINTGEANLLDFVWIFMIMVIVFFSFKTKEEHQYIHLISLIVGMLPIFFVAIELIRIMSTGLVLSFNVVFMLFEALLITGINILNFIDFRKQIKTNE